MSVRRESRACAARYPCPRDSGDRRRAAAVPADVAVADPTVTVATLGSRRRCGASAAPTACSWSTSRGCRRRRFGVHAEEAKRSTPMSKAVRRAEKARRRAGELREREQRLDQRVPVTKKTLSVPRTEQSRRTAAQTPRTWRLSANTRKSRPSTDGWPIFTTKFSTKIGRRKHQ